MQLPLRAREFLPKSFGCVLRGVGGQNNQQTRLVERSWYTAARQTCRSDCGGINICYISNALLYFDDRIQSLVRGRAWRKGQVHLHISLSAPGEKSHRDDPQQPEAGDSQGHGTENGDCLVAKDPTEDGGVHPLHPRFVNERKIFFTRTLGQVAGPQQVRAEHRYRRQRHRQRCSQGEHDSEREGQEKTPRPAPG